MAQQTINIGAAPNDGTGDPLRTAGDKINDNFTELYSFIASTKVTISSAQLLSANSSPILLIAAPGVSKYIQILKCDIYYNYVTTPYATNLVTRVRYGTGVNVPFAASQPVAYINSTNDIFINFQTESIINNFSLSDFTNKAIYFDVGTGNPTAGDGDLTVYISYSIKDV